MSRQSQAEALAPLVQYAEALVDSGRSATEGLLPALLASPRLRPEEVAWLGDPARLFDAVAHAPRGGRPLPAAIEVVVPPGGWLDASLRPGDILLTRALGEGRLAHAAMLVDGEATPAAGLRSRGLRPESPTEGLFAWVVEGGRLHTRTTDRLARRVGDEHGRLRADQAIVRLTRAARRRASPPTEDAEAPPPGARSIATYTVDTNAPYGSTPNKARPPGLPAWVRQTSVAGAALSEVRRVAGEYASAHGLSSTFATFVEDLAQERSGGRYALPQDGFDAAQRRASRRKTAWGVFQLDVARWRSLPLVSRPERPWDASADDEVREPIHWFSTLYLDKLREGRRELEAAREIRLWLDDLSAFRNYRKIQDARGSTSAWYALEESIRDRVGRAVEAVYPITSGVAAFDASPRGPLLWTRTADVAEVWFQVSTSSDFSNPLWFPPITGPGVQATSARHFTVVVDTATAAPPLTAGQEYFYRPAIKLSGQARHSIVPSEVGRFQVPHTEPATTPWAFAMIADVWAGKKPFEKGHLLILDDVLARTPQEPHGTIDARHDRRKRPGFVLSLGDVPYCDKAFNKDWHARIDRKTIIKGGNVRNFYHRAHRDLRGIEEYQRLLRHAVTSAIYDDHEVINDFNWRTAYDALVPPGIAAWADYFPHRKAAWIGTTPAAQLRRGVQPNTRSFTWGPRAEFYLLDTRTQRFSARGQTPTILGTPQMNALLQWLRTSTAPLKFVATSVPLSLTSGPSSDSWDGFTAERQRLFDEIRSIKGQRGKDFGQLMFVTGDQHWFAVHEYFAPGTSVPPGPDDAPEFVEIQVSAISAELFRITGLPSHRSKRLGRGSNAWVVRRPFSAKKYGYAMVHVDESNTAGPSCVFELWGQDKRGRTSGPRQPLRLWRYAFDPSSGLWSGAP